MHGFHMPLVRSFGSEKPHPLVEHTIPPFPLNEPFLRALSQIEDSLLYVSPSCPISRPKTTIVPFLSSKTSRKSALLCHL